jgi:thymidine kinase
MQASRSQRMIAAEGQLFVGGAAAYEARCRRCFVGEPIAK